MFTEILEPYKQEKSNENLAFVIENPKFELLALAWTKIPKKFKTPPPNADLEKLWECVEFDFVDLERATNQPLLWVINMFDLLRRHNLIYPDGTMAPAVVGIMRGRILQKLNMFKGELK